MTKIILETKRLLLREFESDDARFIYELNLNPNVIKYTGNTAFNDVNEARQFITDYSDYRENGFGRWVVINKSTSELLGWCGLKYDDTLDETDIGFRFFESFWNLGYATESAKACLDFGFKHLKLTKIVGRAMKDNIASVKVLEKIGLVYERDQLFDGNEGVIYS